MSELDKSEYQRIEAAIRATEKALADNPHIRSDAAAAFLEPSKKRLATMDEQGVGFGSTQDERKRQESATIAIVGLVMQETHLNAQEKEIYSSFLKKDDKVRILSHFQDGVFLRQPERDYE